MCCGGIRSRYICIDRVNCILHIELTTNCSQLKLKATDGKRRLTDVANTEQLLRIIQSIPSKKTEPFKLWLAQVGRERIEKSKSFLSS